MKTAGRLLIFPRTFCKPLEVESNTYMPTAGPRRLFDRREVANRGGRGLLMAKETVRLQAAKGGMYALWH
jgi:hypothetical protein